MPPQKRQRARAKPKPKTEPSSSPPTKVKKESSSPPAKRQRTKTKTESSSPKVKVESSSPPAKRLRTETKIESPSPTKAKAESSSLAMQPPPPERQRAEPQTEAAPELRKMPEENREGKHSRFVEEYMKIMAEIATAMTAEDSDFTKVAITAAVESLVKLYEEPDRTTFQLALLSIQIAWWGAAESCDDPRAYAAQIPALCEEMRRVATEEFEEDTVLEEVLELLEREARDAGVYAGKQMECVARRERGAKGKWNESCFLRDVERPWVVPGSKRIEVPRRTGADDDDAVEEDEMMGTEEYDDQDEEYEGGEEYDGSEGAMDDSTNLKEEEHKMKLLSNSGDVVAEISDLESSVYLKGFLQCWKDDRAAWRKYINLWEKKHGVAGRSSTAAASSTI